MRKPRRAQEAGVAGNGDRLVMIGGGMVAWRLCRQLVEHGLHRERRITVIGDESCPAYDRIRLSECLEGTAPADLALDRREWYGDHGIELLLGATALAVQPERNLVQTTLGERGYAQAVLATGARPFLPPTPGAELPGVFTYRTIADVTAITALAERGRRVVIVGGGLLGLELAKGLADRGLNVCILERSPGLMVRQLNPVASGILRAQVEGLGIAVHVDVRVEDIATNPERGCPLVVRTAERLAHPADLVVIAAGVRPRDELARAAGLTCSPSGGVVTDRFLRTSVRWSSASRSNDPHGTKAALTMHLWCRSLPLFLQSSTNPSILLSIHEPYPTAGRRRATHLGTLRPHR
ncbi:MAG: NAD(P)/FAD-dependent oxidoreductase [Planctomycetes bacterium]|nr:NAD(P)/FAD-dependent oxidoreductase [Planctomycetota bacterium]